MTSTESVLNEHLLQVRVARRCVEAEGIISLALSPVTGDRLPRFTAGAHIDVHLPRGHLRQYSLYGDPTIQDCYEIAILREDRGRGGSKSAHDDLRVGDILQISPPRNHFALQAAPHSILMAGGIGITPLLCMAQQLHADGASFELHYCARSIDRAAFRATLAEGSLADRVRFHFDDGPSAQRLDAKDLLGSCAPETHLYVCGPTGFMEHVTGAARDLGWPEARIHYEYFAAPADAKPAGEAFQVECARAGKVVDVLPGQSIAGALLRHGIDVPLSCEQGICGTCLVKVLDGVPDHRDHFLSAAEQAANSHLLVCCSRSLSPRLIIDL